MLVAQSDLRVALEEQLLVVTDPVKHLEKKSARTQHRGKCVIITLISVGDIIKKKTLSTALTRFVEGRFILRK